jgi:hypothetical protein
MTTQEIWTLQRLGFTRTHLGKGLHGERLWCKRTDTEMVVVRQRDGAIKAQDLDGMFRRVLPDNTPQSNRQWARDMANDPLTVWRHEGDTPCIP